MGQGGSITLVNGTKYDWENTHQHSYQMNTWNFPSIIKAGTSAEVYVEWDESHTNSDDAGEVVYSLNSTDLDFQIQAKANNGYNLQVVFTNFSTPNNPQGSTISLGWNHDSPVNFILSGEVNNFTSSNLPTSWMQDNLNMLGNRNLRQL